MSPEFWLYPKKGETLDIVALKDTMLTYDCAAANPVNPDEIIVASAEDAATESVYAIFITLSPVEIKIDMYGDHAAMTFFKPMLSDICAAGIDRAEDAESRTVQPIEGLTLAETLLY